MFITTLHHFRRVMCSTKYTIAQKDVSFESLIEDYFRCDLTDVDMKMFETATREWSRRKCWEELNAPL